MLLICIVLVTQAGCVSTVAVREVTAPSELRVDSLTVAQDGNDRFVVDLLYSTGTREVSEWKLTHDEVGCGHLSKIFAAGRMEGARTLRQAIVTAAGTRELCVPSPPGNLPVAEGVLTDGLPEEKPHEGWWFSSSSGILSLWADHELVAVIYTKRTSPNLPWWRVPLLLITLPGAMALDVLTSPFQLAIVIFGTGELEGFGPY